jgi:FKBP-type peptidyl-prolyl cis-trans isomerase FklB
MKLSVITLLVCLGCASAYAADNQTGQMKPDNTAQVSSGQLTGEAYLAANKKKPGVVTLPDGLQYKVITQGKGNFPGDSDTVTVDYSGTLIDGTEFDSSYKRGTPATFPVQGVIAGWTEALKLMRAGSTWMLYIPPALAYGSQGAPPSIGPNETLIFKVNLIDIKKP